MPIDTSLASFGQVSKKLCLFKPSQPWEPLPGHCCSRALSRDNVPLKVSYLLAHRGLLSILEPGRHKLFKAYGFTLMTPNPRGWEAFQFANLSRQVQISSKLTSLLLHQTASRFWYANFCVWDPRICTLPLCSSITSLLMSCLIFSNCHYVNSFHSYQKKILNYNIGIVLNNILKGLQILGLRFENFCPLFVLSVKYSYHFH
jgi:hypothetical protein